MADIPPPPEGLPANLIHPVHDAEHWWGRLENLFDVFRDVLAGIHEIKGMMADLQPVLVGLQPFIHDIGPLIKDMAPLIRDMKPVLADVQNVIHDVHPVVTDVQHELRGPDLTGWENLKDDVTGEWLTLKDALAHLKGHVGHPDPTAPGQPSVFAMLQTIANALAPIAQLLPHPFGLEEPPSTHPEGKKEN